MVAIIWETRYETIFASIPYDETMSTDSGEFQGADVFVRFVCGLFWAVALAEFIIIFTGLTLFNNQFNLLMILSHVFSVFTLIQFKRSKAITDDFF